MLYTKSIACFPTSTSFPMYAHLELVNEHSNRVELVALVLVLHIRNLSCRR